MATDIFNAALDRTSERRIPIAAAPETTMPRREPGHRVVLHPPGRIIAMVKGRDLRT